MYRPGMIIPRLYSGSPTKNGFIMMYKYKGIPFSLR